MLTTKEFSYLLPYLVSLALSLGVGIYSWRRRTRAGALAFALVAFSEAFWTLGAVFENTTPSLAGKVFWDILQWWPVAFQPVAFLVFVLRYTKIKIPTERWVLGFLYAYCVGFTLIVFTNPLHHWIDSNPYLVPEEPFSALLYNFTPFLYTISGFGYFIMFANLLILIVHSLRTSKVDRLRNIAIIGGFVVPMIGGIISILGIPTPLGQRDITPITFGFGNIIFAWGLFRFGLFDIAPIARNILIDEMQDGVIVIDMAGQVIDINPALERMINAPRSSVIGLDQTEVFARWHQMLEKYKDISLIREEIEFGAGDEKQYFEFSISPVHDRKEQLMGKLIVLRDITEKKAAEILLQNEKLRIEEFAHNLESLRALSEFLQASLTPKEAGAFVSHQITNLFPETSGALYIFSDTTSELKVEARWGSQENIDEIINIENCWALRRGRPYERNPQNLNLACNHVGDGKSIESFCLPLTAQGENIGLISFWIPTHIEGNSTYFSDEKRNLALACADSIALSLANLRLRARLNDAFERFVSPELAKEVSRHGASLGGSVVNVTVLFADIRGFTSLAEILSPHDVVGFLNRYFEVMEPVIANEGGWINKFGGDSLLAVFGTPTPYPDHSIRAVRAAQNMRAALAKLNEEQVRHGKPIIRIGVGVHSGEVVAGSIGSPHRMEYTIIGDTVNVTQRIDDLNKSWETDILISEETLSLLGDGHSVRAMPPAMVKGKTKPIQVYAL